jgi:hypothetical protein
VNTARAGLGATLPPVKVSQTRLERRSHRPAGEACADSVHARCRLVYTAPPARLLREGRQLEESRQLLNMKIR